MQELTIQLAAQLKNSILLNRKVKLIQKKNDGQWHVLSEDSKGNSTHHLFDEVISTLPATASTKSNGKVFRIIT